MKDVCSKRVKHIVWSGPMGHSYELWNKSTGRKILDNCQEKLPNGVIYSLILWNNLLREEVEVQLNE